MEIGQMLEIKLTEIHVDDEFNSRGKILPTEVVELAKDIGENGLIQPVTVMAYRPEDVQKFGKKYKLIAGFRRRYAHVVLSKETILAIVKDWMPDSAAVLMNLSENLNRKNLTILQEAKALQRLRIYDFSEEEIGRRTGMSRGWVQVRTMLLSLPESIQLEVEAGFINNTQIRELYSVYRAAGQEACYAAVKRLKDAKAMGRKETVNPNKLNKDAKRVRSRGEIQEMLEHVMDAIGSGLHSRALAWASGEISDNELFQSIKEYAEIIEKPYHIPS